MSIVELGVGALGFALIVYGLAWLFRMRRPRDFMRSLTRERRRVIDGQLGIGTRNRWRERRRQSRVDKAARRPTGGWCR